MQSETRRLPKKDSQGKVVARLDELKERATKKFLLQCHGRTVEALLLRFEGKIYAYLNRCCHIPMSMDWVDNEFFTEDRRYLICATHGATYEPSTGECLWGPCPGAVLQTVPLEIKDGNVVAFCPEDK